MAKKRRRKDILDTLEEYDYYSPSFMNQPGCSNESRDLYLQQLSVPGGGTSWARTAEEEKNKILNLKMLHIIGSSLAKARGQNVTIFSRFAYFSWYMLQEFPVNGGLSQNFRLQAHLEKAVCDINYCLAAKDFSGCWEYWRPQWACSLDTKHVYRGKFRKLISELQGSISANDIQHLVRFSFEESAKIFMKETIALEMKSRPKGLWGYCLYFDCHNYNFHEQNYSGSCPKSEVLRNNKLSWLWNSNAALYPSIDKKSLVNSQILFAVKGNSQLRVNESVRISSMTSQDYALPVFVTRLGYGDELLLFLFMVNYCWNNVSCINALTSLADGALGWEHS
ncbi:LOW QUALITY PROTEIN: hyaluronidase-4-like [Eudromia elegans]